MILSVCKNKLNDICTRFFLSRKTRDLERKIKGTIKVVLNEFKIIIKLK